MPKSVRRVLSSKSSPFQSGKVVLSTIFIFAIAIILPIVFITRGFGNNDLRGDAATSDEFLKTQGKDLVYKGVKVTLRGVNFDNIGALGADIGSNNSNDMSIVESDYQQLAALGGNHARLGLSYTWWKDNPTQFYAKVDQQVAWARKHNVFLLLLNFVNPDGGNGCYEGYGNHCSMWTNSGQQQESLNFWKAVMARYKDEPAVIGYDLVNEPTPPGPGWCRTWFDMAQSWINQLTPIAPNQLIFIESCSDPSWDRVFKNPSGGKATNVVYEMHDYAPMGITHPGYNPSPARIGTYPGTHSAWVDGVEKNLYWDKTTFDGSRYSDYSTRKATGKEWADNNDVPHYIGEWGTQSHTNGYTQYIRDKGDNYNKLGVNHAYYTWKHDISGGWRWGMIGTNGGVDQAKVDAVTVSLAGSIKPTFGGGAPNVPSPTATSAPASPSPKPPTPTPGVTPKPPTPSPSVIPTIKPTAIPTPKFSPAPSPTPSPIPSTNPAGYPRQLQSSNSRIKVWETQPAQGNKIFLRVESDGSFPIERVDWYLNRRWTTVDRSNPYFLGGDSNNAPIGYNLPSGTTEIRSVVYYRGDQYYDTFTSYTTGAPQPTTAPGVTPQPTATPAPSGNVTGLIDIFNEWNTGYCARVVVKNNTNKQIKNWSVRFNLNQGSFTTKWNANFVNVLGNVLAVPYASHSWLPANGSNSNIDWCANKTGSNWRPSGISVIAL